MQQQECTAIVVSNEVLNVNSFKHNITHTFYKKNGIKLIHSLFFPHTF